MNEQERGTLESVQILIRHFSVTSSLKDKTIVGTKFMANGTFVLLTADNQFYGVRASEDDDYDLYLGPITAEDLNIPYLLWAFGILPKESYDLYRREVEEKENRNKRICAERKEYLRLQSIYKDTPLEDIDPVTGRLMTEEEKTQIKLDKSLDNALFHGLHQSADMGSAERLRKRNYGDLELKAIAYGIPASPVSDDREESSDE